MVPMPTCPLLRRILRLFPQRRPKLVQHQRDGHHHKGQESKKGRRPARREPLIHLRREQRKPGTEQRAHHGIGCERGRGDEQVRVDDVVEQAQEDPHDGEPERPAGQHRCPEAHGRVRRPSEPEERQREYRRGADRLLEADLRGYGVRRHFAAEPFVVWVPVEDVVQNGDEAAEGDGQVHEAQDAGAEVVTFGKDDRVCFEQEVDDAIDKLPEVVRASLE